MDNTYIMKNNSEESKDKINYRKLLDEYYEYLGLENAPTHMMIKMHLTFFADWLNLNKEKIHEQQKRT